MAESIIEFLKTKYIAVVLIVSAFVLLSVSYNFFHSSFGTDVYTADKFKSDYTSSDEKIIEEGSELIFTYGPYINLKKGEYIFHIYYSGDFDNEYDITSGFAENIIYEGLLPADKNYVEAVINLEDDIFDESIEIRTKYNGYGKFEFQKAEVQRNTVDINRLKSIFLFIFIAAEALILFRSKREILYSVFLWFLANYLFSYGYMTKNTSNFQTAAVIIIALTAAVFFLKNKIAETIKNVRAEEFICMLLCSYIGSSVLLMFINKVNAESIEFVKNTDIYDVLFFMSIIFSIISAMRIILKNSVISYRFMFFSVFFYAAMIIFECGRNIYLTVGVTAMLAYFIYYLCDKGRINVSELEVSYKTAFIVLSVCFAAVFVFISWSNICKYRTFSYETFDFGIFSQMFENMAKTGVPVTTCERGELLSHFYIHFSPVYYFILPVYMLFRSPETLLAVQAFAVSSVVFPVFLLCRKYRLSGLMTIAAGIAVLTLPAFICSLYWGFHENKFLAVFILWFIYFMESKKNIGAFIFMALTLMVKEDAALYIICICVYYLAEKRERKRSLIVLACSIVYFILVMIFIQSNGRSLMSAHYKDYYLPGQEGVWDMLHNIISNPTFFIKNNFTENNFIYILYVMVPFLFVPMAAKNFKRFILLIPLVVMNTMTPYVYQHDVFYQYSYGSSALIIFLFIMNLSGRNVKFKYAVCFAAVFASFFMTYTNRGNQPVNIIERYYDGKENRKENRYDYYDEVLAAIPKDASVAAENLILPHLYYHYELYLYKESFDIEKYNTDYIVLDQKNSFDLSKIENEGYEIEYSDDKLLIYKKYSADEMKL